MDSPARSSLGRGGTSVVKCTSRSLLWLVAFCAISVVIGLVAYGSYLRHAGATASGVSSRSANKMLWAHLQLPEAAGDVTYYVDFGACEAEFAIPEGDLLRWCQEKGWTVEPITLPTPYFDPMWLPPSTINVTQGLRFSPPDGQGIFDRRTSRAAFWVSTFP